MKIRLIVIFSAIFLTHCRDKTTGTEAGKTENRKISTFGKKSSESSSDIDGLLKRLNGSSKEQGSAPDFERIINNLSDTDLNRLLQKISATRNSNQDKRTFAYAVMELARRDPSSALSLFVPDKMQGNEAGWSSVVGILAKSSPELLQKWLREELPKGQRNVQSFCLSMGLTSLSAADPRSAFEFSKNIDRNILSNNGIINSIFEEYGRQFPEDAEKAALGSFKGRDLDLALYYVANGGSGAENSLLKISIASKIVDPELRGGAISGQLKELLELDQPEAVKQILMLHDNDLQAVLKGGIGRSGSLVEKLGSKDPEVLSQLLAKIVPSSSNLGLFRASVETLTKSNPELATLLINSIPDSGMKEDLTGTNYRLMAVANTAQTLAKAAQITDDGLRNAAFSNIGDVVGRGGIEEIKTISANFAAKDKKSFLNAALSYAIDSDPNEAAKFIAAESGSIDDAPRHELLGRLSERLAAADLNSARQWIEKLPVNDQPPAITGLANEMAKTDVQALSLMLTNLPQNKNWEAGVRVLIKNIGDSDPEMAKKWQDSLAAAGYK